MANGTLVYIYELGQLKETLAYLDANPGAVLIAGEVAIEHTLRKKGLPFRSVRDYGEDDPQPLLQWCQDAARGWYHLPDMRFFSHKRLSLGETFEPMLDFYLQRLLRAERLFARVLKRHPECGTLVMPHTRMVASSQGGPLAPLEIRVVVDAAAAACSSAGVPVQFLGVAPAMPAAHLHPHSRLLALLYAVYNRVLGFMRRPLPLRVFVSDQWAHVRPFVDLMPGTEFVFMEKKELTVIPWGQLWRHRIRFMQPGDEAVNARASEARHAYASAWSSVREGVLSEGFPGDTGKRLSLPIGAAVDYLVREYSERAVADYEGLERIFLRERIGRVLLRVGVSGRQPHYFTATRVADALGIPSFELQHAIEVVDPTTVHGRLTTTFLGAYGEGVRRALELRGSSAARACAIGSPRFDSYLARADLATPTREARLAQYGLDSTRPILFVGMPAEVPDLYPVHFSSYDTLELLKCLVEMKRRIPTLQFVLKFRPKNLTSTYRTLAAEMFPEGGVLLAEFEDPFQLLRVSDFAWVANSTLLYEAQLAGVPVVLFPVRTHDTYFIAEFKNAGVAAPDAHAAIEATARLAEDPAFKARVIRLGSDFLADRCRFDGKSAERMAALLRDAACS